MDSFVSKGSQSWPALLANRLIQLLLVILPSGEERGSQLACPGLFKEGRHLEGRFSYTTHVIKQGRRGMGDSIMDGKFNWS